MPENFERDLRVYGILLLLGIIATITLELSA